MARNYGLPPTRYSVTITHDGVEHRGSYTVAEGRVFVHFDGRTADAELGGLKHYPEQLAEMLLSELVRGLL